MDILNNLTSKAQLHYVTERKTWAVKWVGKYIIENLTTSGLIDARLTTTPWGIRNKIVHFGSLSTLQPWHPSNKAVLTCFHIAPNDARIDTMRHAWKYLDIVHTTNQITKNKLVEMWASEDKIVVIPLGVDLRRFSPVSSEEKGQMKEHLGIPKDKIVIGNFSKDGNGWGVGMEQKWIKGADVFVDVVSELKREYSNDIFVLLTGAARGYIKKELKKKGIPYKHVYLEDYLKISIYYNTLDLYIVPSRVEGGPQAILESMASGVPLVSTKVGMAPDVIKDGENGMLADVDDKCALFDKAVCTLDNNERAQRMVQNGLETVKNYSWDKIAVRYYNEIYRRFL